MTISEDLSARPSSPLWRAVEQGLRCSVASLGQMLSTAVRIEAAHLLPTSEAACAALSAVSAQGVEVRLPFAGDLSGAFFLALTRSAAQWIVHDLTGEDSGLSPLTELAGSALKETGNIVASSFFCALEQLDGTVCRPDLPQLQFYLPESSVAAIPSTGVVYGLPVTLTCTTSKRSGAGMFVLLAPSLG